MTQIFIVRHGETFAKTNQNELGVPFICGSGSELSRNTHLTSNGKEQMFLVGEKYKDKKFDIVIVSDLIRSQESAEEFLRGAGQENLISQILVNREFTEIDYGQDDGVIEEVVKAKKKSFFADTTKTALDYDTSRGGETFVHAGERMRQAVLDIASKNKNKIVLIISHSGAIRAFAGNIIVSQDLKFGEVLKVESDGKVINFVNQKSYD